MKVCMSGDFMKLLKQQIGFYELNSHTGQIPVNVWCGLWIKRGI